MNGKGARNKGARGENELAKILTDELGFEVKRKLGQARDGEDDIQVRHFRIEVKRRERLQIEEWCKQVEACTEEGEVPVVAFRRNGQPWRVVLPLNWFIKAMREGLE